MALKLRHHDADLHARRAPAGETARAVFESLEQVRVETIGSRHMAGVAANLDAALAGRCQSRGYARITDVEDAPIAEAVGMMARERWSGRSLPEAARPLMDLWREQIGDRIDADLEALQTAIGDQETFARTVNKLLYDLDLLDEEPGEGESESTDQGEDSEESDSEDEDAEATEMDGAAAEMEGSPSSEMEDGEGEDSEDSMAEQVQEEMMPGTGDEEGERAQRRRADGFLPDEARQPAYRPYTVDFDEVVDAEELCDADELGRLRQASRSAAGPSPGDHRQAGQPVAAPPASPAVAILGIRPRGRAARRRQAVARRGQPAPPLELQDRETDRVPRHRRLAVDR